MSKSNSAHPDEPRWQGWKALGVLAIVVVVGFAIIKMVPMWKHSADGREINSLGAELVTVLDSYGATRLSEGKRESVYHDDLFNPINKWGYSAEAEYAIEPRDDSRKTSEEAYNAFRNHLTDHGWEDRGSSKNVSIGGVVFTRNGWKIRVFYETDEQASNTIIFGIESPNSAALF